MLEPGSAPEGGPPVGPATGRNCEDSKVLIQIGWAMSPFPRTSLVAALASGHVILLWETATGRLVHQFEGHEKTTLLPNFTVPIAFSPDGGGCWPRAAWEKNASPLGPEDGERGTAIPRTAARKGEGRTLTILTPAS